MHQKTETKVDVRWVKRREARLQIADLELGTVLIDADCELYLVTSNGAFSFSTGKYFHTRNLELPDDVRVVPKVTFHVELEGEG